MVTTSDLFRYRAQLRREFPRSPAAVTTSSGNYRPIIPGGGLGAFIDGKIEGFPATPAFLVAARAAAALGQRGASFDGQCGHFLGLEAALQAAQRQREVELSGLELLVAAYRGDNVAEVHFVGVTYEDGRVLL